ncbi:cytochrome P450 2H1-like [Mercenaria mercenaria]|uniref:cytochrome P450 2H1-like n=1 Tax=Mercenaria mercenaria TaxID=6596 RepID=UPI00234F873F|nr:cytochrome P450 2H1-like [Mercenaria mercenaria]
MRRILDILQTLLNYVDEIDVKSFLVFLSTFLLVYWNTRRRTGVPPGPPLLPLIGNLHCLATKDVIGKLCDLRKAYGDIFGIYIGGELTVFLNGYDAIHEALVKRGSLFTWRPVSRLNELTFIHHGFLMHNGRQWKEQRNFTQSSLRQLCFHNNGMHIQEILNREILHLVDKLKTFQRPFDIETLFNISSANIVSTILFDCRFAFEDEKAHALLDLVRRSGEEFVIKEIYVNCLPFLTKLPVDLLGISKSRKAFHGLFEWPTQYINNIKQKYSMGTESYWDTFTGMYLRKIEQSAKGNVTSTFCEGNLKGSAVDLVSAGSSTVAETLKVILLYLIRNPEIQEKMYSEISELIGKDPPMLRDRKKLPYVQAVIHEGIRILHVAPFGLPRSVTSDVEFRGHLIPKNCTVLVNIESLMKDPTVWKDPHEFKPERFLNADQTELSVPREFMPFSKGPRSCVGETIARIELFQFLTVLVQNFKFLPATDGQFPEVKAKFVLSMVCEPYQMRAIMR